MNFGEAMTEVMHGGSVRRAGWGARRAIRLMVEPWNGERERVLIFDRTKKGDVPPFPFSPSGEDVRTDDWETVIA